MGGDGKALGVTVRCVSLEAQAVAQLGNVQKTPSEGRLERVAGAILASDTCTD